MKKRLVNLVGATAILLSSAFNVYSAPEELGEATLERETQSLEYSFADIAAAELAMYGILPEQYMQPQEETRKPFGREDAVSILYNMFFDEAAGEHSFPSHPFTDVDKKYDEAISWAYSNGVTLGISENLFGTYNITEYEFVTLLLRAMGYGQSFQYTESIEVAYYVGFEYIPLYQSDFTLGNAAQYLSYSLNLNGRLSDQPLREWLHLNPSLEKTAYPYRIIISPRNKAEAENNILMATSYFPYEIIIQGDRMQAEDFSELYREYLDLIYERDNRKYTTEPWWQGVISAWSKISVSLSTTSESFLSEDDRKIYSALQDELYIHYVSGEISAVDYLYQKETLMLDWLPVSGVMRICLYYNEPYMLSHDNSPIFRLFLDERVKRWADEQYQRYVAPAAEGDAYDAIMAAKQLVLRLASYDPYPTGQMDSGRQDVYRYESHSILGAYLDGHIVCDGYSYLFMYFLQRAGIPCFEMLGSTFSSEEAEKGITDHSWVKLKLNGNWYNCDICWEDDFGWGTQLDLKSDSVFRSKRHWAAGFDSGVFASEENYAPSV